MPASELIWVSRDGRRYTIAEMETIHIHHSIALIERSIAAGRPWRADWLPWLELELVIRTTEEEIAAEERHSELVRQEHVPALPRFQYVRNYSDAMRRLEQAAFISNQHTSLEENVLTANRLMETLRQAGLIGEAPPPRQEDPD